MTPTSLSHPTLSQPTPTQNPARTLPKEPHRLNAFKILDPLRSSSQRQSSRRPSAITRIARTTPATHAQVTQRGLSELPPVANSPAARKPLGKNPPPQSFDDQCQRVGAGRKAGGREEKKCVDGAAVGGAVVGATRRGGGGVDPATEKSISRWKCITRGMHGAVHRSVDGHRAQ